MSILYEILKNKNFPSDHITGTLGSLDLNITLIQCCGIPFIGAKKVSKTSKFLVVIYGSIVMIFISFLYTACEIYDMVLCWGNFNAFIQNTCLTLCHIAGVLKTMNAIYWRKDILRIIEQFKELTKTYIISEAQKKAFYRGEFENKIPITFHALLVGVTSILVFIVLSPAKNAGKRFPLMVRLPDFLPITVQSAYMVFSVFTLAMQVVVIDYLNVILINQVRYQMKILNIAFDTLATDVDTDVNLYLNKLLMHHAEILRTRDKIESIFTFPLVAQFLASLLICALSGFHATTVEMDSGALVIYIYAGSILFELFMYCWFGNEVSEQSKTLASRGYNSRWYAFNMRYKKSLLIFLINAQRPLYFTVGGFLNLSLTTFTGILSKSYTYIAVLRQIYAEK